MAHAEEQWAQIDANDLGYQKSVQSPDAEDLVRENFYRYTGATVREIVFQTSKAPGSAYYQFGWNRYVVTTLEGLTYQVVVRTFPGYQAYELDAKSFFSNGISPKYSALADHDEWKKIEAKDLESQKSIQNPDPTKLIRDNFYRYTGATPKDIVFQTQKAPGSAYYQFGWRRYIVSTLEGKTYQVVVNTFPGYATYELTKDSFSIGEVNRSAGCLNALTSGVKTK